MIAVVCVALSAIGFYFSMGLGDQWWLAWLAPIPVLWFAFGETKPWPIFFAAFAAHHDRSQWHNPPCTHGCDP